MIRITRILIGGTILCLTAALAGAQTAGGRLSFDRPESWALKYFTSGTLFTGLQPPMPGPEGHKVGSVTVGLEAGWIPALSPEQSRVGFTGRAQEDLNKAPIMVRPVVRLELPGKFALLAAAPPPFEVFGLTPHLLALGLERPIVEREQWRLGVRVSGQTGYVVGAFTCPQSVLAFDPGSPGNPGRCLQESSDHASLHYIGTELQYAHRI